MNFKFQEGLNQVWTLYVVQTSANVYILYACF